MALQLTQKELRELVLDELRARFPGVYFSSVKVTPDKDEDGDDILIIRVVFDETKKIPSASGTASFTRYAMNSLSNKGIDAFPVFSYVSKSDEKKLRTGTAA